jgi:hypothetical protein
VAHFEIQPGIGVGPIRFGMTVDEVRKAMGLPFCVFSKTVDSSFPTDAFDEAGVHVYYKAFGICEAVELWGDAEVFVGSYQLLRIDCLNARAILRSIDPDCVLDENGITSTALGVSVSCSGPVDDSSAWTEAVLVFEPGYYS